jgi:hypothetical protein
LAKHGGVWLDATTWVNENPSEYLRDMTKSSGFFAYRYSNTRISSWLISSHQGNYVPALLYEVLCNYWNEHSELIGYFMFHDLFECLYFADERFRAIVDASTFRDANPPHIVQREYLFQEFDQEAIDLILADHPIQKYTYKVGKRNIGPGTTFEHIVSLLTT